MTKQNFEAQMKRQNTLNTQTFGEKLKNQNFLKTVDLSLSYAQKETIRYWMNIENHFFNFLVREISQKFLVHPEEYKEMRNLSNAMSVIAKNQLDVADYKDSDLPKVLQPYEHLIRSASSMEWDMLRMPADTAGLPNAHRMVKGFVEYYNDQLNAETPVRAVEMDITAKRHIQLHKNDIKMTNHGKGVMVKCDFLDEEIYIDDPMIKYNIIIIGPQQGVYATPKTPWEAVLHEYRYDYHLFHVDRLSPTFCTSSPRLS